MNSAASSTANTNTRAKALSAAAITPVRLFSIAISRIESESIRAWARGNRAVWLKIADGWLREHGARFEAGEAGVRFATYITLTAMG